MTHARAPLVGIPNRGTRLRARLLGSVVPYPVHWIESRATSAGCYGRQCRHCPDVRSYWFALAAQQELRRAAEEALPREYPAGFERWLHADQQAWRAAHPRTVPEQVEELEQVPVTLTLYENWYADLVRLVGSEASASLRGVEVLVSRASHGAAVRVEVAGVSQLGLLDDFAPTAALVKRYGPAIADGIAQAREELAAARVVPLRRGKPGAETA